MLQKKGKENDGKIRKVQKKKKGSNEKRKGSIK